MFLYNNYKLWQYFNKLNDKKGMKSLRNREKEKNKNHLFIKLILELIIVFIIATIAIVLYDMYIKIEVEDNSYTVERVSKEISINNTEDISQMLEEVSKSVVGISKIENIDMSIFSLNSEKKLSLGSGIIVASNGYILTNEHVSRRKI